MWIGTRYRLAAAIVVVVTLLAGCGGLPNTGESELYDYGNGAPRAPLIAWEHCAKRLVVLHRIVTHDTPRARDLLGKLTVTVKSGDPATVELTRLNLAGAPMRYNWGDPIAIDEPNHSGGGEHTWHTGLEYFQLRGLKPGRVTLEATVDPDLETPEGKGHPTKIGSFEVVVPKVISIRVADKTAWTDLDWKTVLFRSDPLRLIIEIDPPITTTDEVPCNVKISTKGTTAASEGTKPGGADVDIHLRTTLANGGRELHVSIDPPDLIAAGVIGATPKDAVIELTTADYVKNPPASNFNDSGAFDAESRRLGQVQRGKARSIDGGVDGNASATPPESSINLSFMQAAGVELVEAELHGTKSEKRQIQNQADTLYYSGHGSHGSASVAVMGGWFGPADVARGEWKQELDRVFFAGCAVLDIKDYNNNYSGWGGHGASPGEKWIGTGPRMFFGYNYKAPLDDNVGNAFFTADVVTEYFRRRSTGMAEPMCWMKANEKMVPPNPAPGTHDKPGAGRCLNACAIDLRVSPPQYYYFDAGNNYKITVKTPPW